MHHAGGRRDLELLLLEAEERARRTQGHLRLRRRLDLHGVYLGAVDLAFGKRGIDYAMLQEIYGKDMAEEKRYSPAICTGIKQDHVWSLEEIASPSDPVALKSLFARFLVVHHRLRVVPADHDTAFLLDLGGHLRGLGQVLVRHA